MNKYEEKQARRRERLEERADKARAEAKGAEQRARYVLDNIPMGQPILVGHHSEKRHRRDLAKADSAMRKAVDDEAKADRLERRAASVGTAGISQDDPDAVAKLRAKLAKLEEQRAEYKAFNKQARREGKDALPGYVLTNLGGNIRRVKARIAELEAAAQQVAAPDVEFPGGRIVENVEENRLQIVFDGKPDAAVRAELKRWGFRWSPSQGAWQRHLSHGARHAARAALGLL